MISKVLSFAFLAASLIFFFHPICNVKTKSCHGLSIKHLGEEWIMIKPFTVFVLRASTSPNKGAMI